MSERKKGPQDLPPKGSYPPFHINRVKLRSYIGGRFGLAFICGIQLLSWPLYYTNWVEQRKKQIENISIEMATIPMLYAERDRALLKQMRRLRDLEEDVMKDFPSWEVGTFFGVPIYESLPKDKYVDPHIAEMNVATDPEDYPYVIGRTNRMFGFV